MRTATHAIICAFLLAMLAACARVPYPYTSYVEKPDTLRLKEGEPQIARGEPVPVVDALGHYVLSLPSKLLLWNWKVDCHRISPETEETVAAYLKANGLRQVKVRLNQYEPRDEWRRLVRNSAMPGFWRYTFGVLTCAEYTALPGRLFGGDCYNPYTNSVSIYSDHRAIALHECAHAKDFAGRSRAMKVIPPALTREAEYTRGGIPSCAFCLAFPSIRRESPPGTPSATSGTLGTLGTLGTRASRRDPTRSSTPPTARMSRARGFGGAGAMVGLIRGHLRGGPSRTHRGEDQGRDGARSSDSTLTIHYSVP